MVYTGMTELGDTPIFLELPPSIEWLQFTVSRSFLPIFMEAHNKKVNETYVFFILEGIKIV